MPSSYTRHKEGRKEEGKGTEGIKVEQNGKEKRRIQPQAEGNEASQGQPRTKEVYDQTGVHQPRSGVNPNVFNQRNRQWSACTANVRERRPVIRNPVLRVTYKQA